LPSHQSPNSIHQLRNDLTRIAAESDECVRIPLCSYLNHPRFGHDTRAGWRWRNAAGAHAPPHLLGARYLDCEPLYLSSHSVVDFLSMAQPARMDILPVRLRSGLTHDFVSRFDASFSTGRRHRRISRLQTHYYENHRAIFAIFSMFSVVDVADTLLKGVPHFFALGTPYIISSVVYFSGMMTAAFTRNERYHQFYPFSFSSKPP
jgi:hypothetical protein